MTTARAPRLTLDAGLSRLSIRARLVLLSSVLLLILLGTSTFLSHELDNSAAALGAEALPRCCATPAAPRRPSAT